MSIPLLDDGALIGVLALYTDSTVPITDGQQRIMEALAPHTAGLLRRASVATATELHAQTPASRAHEPETGQERRTWARPQPAAQ
jgi:GAF domain-containing protein